MNIIDCKSSKVELMFAEEVEKTGRIFMPTYDSCRHIGAGHTGTIAPSHTTR